jgi:osmotically-inducible protein OsmY
MATNTAIINGSVNAAAKTGFNTGSLYVGGERVVLQSLTTSLQADFNFSTDIPDEFAGIANISQSLLTDNTFGTIGLGYNPDDTGDGIVADEVVLKEGTVLEAETIILGAKNAITVEKGAQVLAIASDDNRGEITLTSPSGSIIIKEEAVVRASDAINIDTTNLSLDPSAVFTSDHSELNLTGPKITFVQDGYVRSDTDTGIFLTATQFASLISSFENVGLKSTSDIVFEGDFDLSVTDTLTLDTGLIQGTDGGTVQLTAGTIYILNTAATPSIELGSSGQGTIIFIAKSGTDTTSGNIYVGKGTVLFDGFSSVGDVTEKGGFILNAQNDLVFRGAGTLDTGNADLNITASRVTTSYYTDSDTYTAADFSVDAGTGIVNIAGAADRNAGNDSVTGTLAISGNSIRISTLIEIPSGRLKLTATENISLNEGAEIMAAGTDSAPGGDVVVTSTGDGSISLASGASIDVSAGTQGDAGSISLYAPVGGVVLMGDIQGQAATNSAGDQGQGGSFSVVTNSLAASAVMDFSTLNAKLSEGGFDGDLDVRTTVGDITIGAEDAVDAGTVKITSDDGSIYVYGNVDVSRNDQGGTAELYAKNDLIFSGYIDASGVGESSTGGDVVLAVDTGTLTLSDNGVIDVSGSETGGTVSFQGSLSGADYNQLNMSLNGTVTGAAAVYVDAVRTYTGYTTVNSSALNTIKANTTTFMNSGGNLKSSLLSGLQGVDEEDFHLRPSIVIANNEGDLTLSGDLDLTTWRYAGETGTLTLRAAGDLNINANIIDNPTNSYSTLWSGTMKDSWDINLTAGAVTTSPDLMATDPIQNTSTGDLTIASNKVVYTESGSISFASGGDTTINQGASNSYMIASSTQYALASYGGSIEGDVAGDLNIVGGVVQTALGDIDISTGGDLMLGANSAGTYKGTIRTTGERAEGKTVNAYETYTNGGDIYLSIGGDVRGSLSSSYWLTYKTERISGVNHYIIIPVYGNHPTEGIATLAGGDVYIKAGGSYFAQTGTFGEGNLQIYATGDMNGRFLINDGIGELSAGANFGTSAMKPLIEMADAQIAVTAQGDMNIGGILNPALVKNNKVWDNGYTEESSIKLTAISGDVNVGSVDTSTYTFYAGGLDGALSYLPATVDIEAERDINLSSFILMPSETGQLRLVAGRDISGTVTMSDADTSGDNYTVYGELWKITTTNPAPDLTMDHGTVADEDGDEQPLHYYDSEPVSIWAGRDINNMTIILPKKASIHAERDIISLNYTGMNISDSDVSRIYAGGEISYEYSASQATESKKIEQRGPGYLVVQAGGTIDLGNSLGIITTGNSGVASLGSEGSAVLVAAGISRELEWEETITFFNMLREAGDEYSTLLAAGDTKGAQQVIDDARNTIIVPFLGTVNESADIMMTSSQISTQANGDILVLAGGQIDVGKSVIGSTSVSGDTDKNTGIYTAVGGSINVFAVGDINVNEARIMTFMGGDITVWSDDGDVNAGRGSRTAISAIPPRSYIEEVNGVKTVVTKFIIPAVGSGIRAMTYDPDGAGPISAPEAGILHIFAPEGVIDAGEAGMEGASAFIGGVQVLNTQNMSFSQGAVGMPAQTQSVNMGSLAGTGIANKENLSSGLEALSERVDSKSTDPTRPIVEMLQRLDVKVIGYELSLDSSTDDEKRK